MEGGVDLSSSKETFHIIYNQMTQYSIHIEKPHESTRSSFQHSLCPNQCILRLYIIGAFSIPTHPATKQRVENLTDKKQIG
ncbi:hypothetical protein CR513_52174, partial [Mucuna pruriens]